MATDKLPIPKTIEVTLRRDNEAPQCPEVTRCLLSVEREPNPDLLEVVDSGLPSPLINRETTVQVIRAEMVPAGLSCRKDYTLRAGLISTGGPIAVGCRMVRTTSVRAVRIYVASGSEIDSQITTTEEEVGLTAETGTTTTVETVNHGDGTSTTTTTTSVTARDLWERRLEGCAEVENPWMTFPPKHLLNARYVSTSGERVSLIVLQDDIDGNWQVLVERVGGEVASDHLDLRYTASTDDLHVSAALSYDLLNLYVVESRCPGTSASATWYRYVWDMYVGHWDMIATGSVTAPPGVVAQSQRHFVVDRQGKLAGYWSADFDTRNESYHYEHGFCPNGPTDGTTIENYDRSWKDYTGFYGGFWDLSGDGSYQYGNVRTSAQVLAGGDFYPVIEQLLEAGSVLIMESVYSWSNSLPEGTYRAEYERFGKTVAHDDIPWRAIAGEEDIEGNLYDSGLNHVFIASSSASSEVTFPDPYAAGWVHDELDISFDTYVHRDGSRALTITPGGWVEVGYAASVRTPNNMSAIHTEGDWQLSGGPVSWGLSVCPNFLTELESFGMTTTEQRERATVWPASIALSNDVTILRSYTSFDQQTGDNSYGIMTKTGEAEPVWKIYKNGADRTIAIEECIGRPIKNMNAIYWRA